MAAQPTIHDVAAAAGVSIATVSKAVHGRYGVAPATARRVLDIATELGYPSGRGARRMRSHRTGVVGVLVPALEPFSLEVLKGVGAAARGTGMDLLTYTGTPAGDGWERRAVNRFSGTLLDGIILVSPSTVNVTAEVPIVAIDPHAGPADLPVVESDSFAGARHATDHLVALGHTRIGFIAGRPELRSAALREAGYRRSLQDAGIPFDPGMVGVARYQHRAAREVARSLLARGIRPTAIFAANDLSAIAVLAVAEEMGISVPRELSVIGFDDIPESARHNPPLTTVRQPLQRLGRHAAHLLFALMNGQPPPPTRLQLRTRLVVRATTARAPRG